MFFVGAGTEPSWARARRLWEGAAALGKEAAAVSHTGHHYLFTLFFFQLVAKVGSGIT